jgi:hypothetical protein
MDRQLAAHDAEAGVQQLILRLPTNVDAPGPEQAVVDVGETLIGHA